MKKAVLTYGLTMGAIVTLTMSYSVYLCYNSPDMKASEIVGYLGMLVIFSIIFFGIRSYRNKERDGFISFGEAFKVGFFIALIASTIYVIAWMIMYYNFFPDFMDVYAKQIMTQAKADGLSAAEIRAKSAEMDGYKEMYKNPLMVILMTYAEALPMGLVVALISALILRRKGGKTRSTLSTAGVDR